MKTILSPYLIFGLIVTMCCSFQCKKDNGILNINLYGNDTTIIKRYINGKWKLEYDFGGLIANQRTDYHDKNIFWEFDNSKIPETVKQTYLGVLQTDTFVIWNNYTSPPGTNNFYIMEFVNKSQFHNMYTVIGIYNDSLHLLPYIDDASTYVFSRLK